VTESLRELGRRLAPAVLADAVPQAQDLARRRVAARLAEDIVEEILGGPHEPVADARMRTGEARPPETARTGLYAYGVAPADVDPAGIRSLHDDAGPVRKIVRDGLALVVSDIDVGLLEGVEEDLTESGRLASLAQRHDGVLRDLMERSSVLPLRFGTVLRGPRHAAEILDDPDGDLAALLAAVRGTREWGLRVEHGDDERESDGEPESGHPDRAEVDGLDAAAGRAAAGTDAGEPARGGTGTEYLTSRRASLREAEQRRVRTARLLDEVDHSLAAHARDTTSRGRRPGRLFDRAYLVDTVQEEDFLDAARRVIDEVRAAGLAVDLTGPWPPYSFVDVTLGAPADLGVPTSPGTLVGSGVPEADDG